MGVTLGSMLKEDIWGPPIPGILFDLGLERGREPGSLRPILLQGFHPQSQGPWPRKTLAPQTPQDYFFFLKQSRFSLTIL